VADEGFPEAVRRTAARYGMDLSRPLALVSGGPDSVALLRVLLELGARPAVLHVDHGLRGKESRRDAEFVRDLCKDLGLACDLRRARLGRGNLQEEARRERYRLAGEVARECGLGAVATGHTADDVAETVLMNLARGAGLRGLTGIPPVAGPVVRPLIERRRAEVLEYLEGLGQSYRTDASNLTGKYARNRVRLEVLPVLEELYPGAGANIARGAALLREDLEALESLAARAVGRGGEEVVVSLAGLEPPALRRYAVRGAYAALLPDAPPLESRLVEGVLRLAGGEGTRLADLPGGVVAATRPGGEVALYLRAEPVGGEVEVGVGEARFGGWRIEAREVSGFDARDAARAEVAYLDAALGPYRVRTAREGDTMRPLGLHGSKKVLRVMMDRKVPRDLRRRTPVVVGGDGRVAWVFLGELDEAFAVTPRTERILRLEVEKES
jgi:tRNA(Ile)-lysidine synthase